MLVVGTELGANGNARKCQATSYPFFAIQGLPNRIPRMPEQG